ncbi:bifunctional copper resistance protein CopD/cytochrome c oxidase assembly protein [Streptosporangiaceae bacterium NEAU-GS5]|nr:bifunctional copper resistance protein CopD/cytochrome c oxidase assembly protein [Streptosporangiaceae bacterium NEAU-GS5]
MKAPRVRRRALAAAGVLAAAFAVILLALWFGGGKPQPTIPGLPSPGTLTSVGLPLVRLVHDLCAVATVGSLLTAVLLAGDVATAGLLTRFAGRWAIGWALSAACTEILTLSDFLGIPMDQALRSGVLPTFLFYIPQGQAFLAVTVAAVVIAIGAFLPLAAWGRAILLGLAVLAVLPPAYVGHSASSADHNLAISSLMMHIAGVTLWVGGLLGLLLFVRRSAGPAVVVRRFSALALCCFIAVGYSGVINAWIRIGDLSALWESRYGVLIDAKVVALVALGWFGWRHRRTTIAALETSTGAAPFLRLAAGEVTVMAATIGLAVGLSRTAPPTPADTLEHEHALLGYVLPELQPHNLFAEVRPDPIALFAVVGAAVAYLVAVRRLARQGEGWPVFRIVCWMAGLVVLLYGLAGGIAAYAPAVFSLHAVQFALLAAVGPALLVFGAPLTLYQLAYPPRGNRADSGAGRAVTNPLVAFGLYALPPITLYVIGLFEPAQSSLAIRLAVQTFVIAAALLFFTVAMGIDPLPRVIAAATRIRMLLAAAVLEAAIALFLLAGPDQGTLWYSLLTLSWAPERSHDQHVGALLGPGLTIVTIAVLAVILWRRWQGARRRLSAATSTAAEFSSSGSGMPSAND